VNAATRILRVIFNRPASPSALIMWKTIPGSGVRSKCGLRRAAISNELSGLPFSQPTGLTPSALLDLRRDVRFELGLQKRGGPRDYPFEFWNHLLAGAFGTNKLPERPINGSSHTYMLL